MNKKHKILSKNIYNIIHQNNSLFEKCQILFVFITKVFKKRIQKALCEFASK